MATLQRLIEITPHTTITDISLVRRNDILQTLSGNYYIVDSAVHTADGDTFMRILAKVSLWKLSSLAMRTIYRLLSVLRKISGGTSSVMKCPI